MISDQVNVDNEVMLLLHHPLLAFHLPDPHRGHGGPGMDYLRVGLRFQVVLE